MNADCRGHMTAKTATASTRHPVTTPATVTTATVGNFATKVDVYMIYRMLVNACMTYHLMAKQSKQKPESY